MFVIVNEREVRQYSIGPGSFEAEQAFQHHFLAVQPAILSGGGPSRSKTRHLPMPLRSVTDKQRFQEDD